MAIREIVLYPADVLTTPTEEVAEVNDDVRQLVDDLAETMYAAPGIGLAAPQVGVCKRVAVIDLAPPDEDRELLVLINPQIVKRSGEITWEEGCLSFPQLYEKIDRAREVVVKALDRHGRPFELEASELLAVALQHEIDHLDGVLFTDRMSHLKRRRAMKRYKKILEARERGDDEPPEDGEE